MSDILSQLRTMTVIVADTGEIEAVKQFQPEDCTTNPSLVLQAVNEPSAKKMIAREIEAGKAKGLDAKTIADALPVALGVELSKIIKGRVSTEVDASLSFDTHASVKRAKDIIADYKARGVKKDRVLIKLASTWEGIQAAKTLEAEGINCNLTLLFSLTQAIACADAGAFLISPFVGRITDWYKARDGVENYDRDEDPGVLSVREIYNYYKSNGIQTVVMGASFRNIDQIIALAGCDRLTISPKLLDELASTHDKLERALDPNKNAEAHPISMDETRFRKELDENPMATEKLRTGIEGFEADGQKLIDFVQNKL